MDQLRENEKHDRCIELIDQRFELVGLLTKYLADGKKFEYECLFVQIEKLDVIINKFIPNDFLYVISIEVSDKRPCEDTEPSV